MSQEDPQRTVQTFIDLVQRHEQSFYTFVHNVHSKGQGLFDSLMAWIELFLSYARDGLPHPVDLEFILPHAGETRAKIMAEVDAVAQYHYKLKVAHEEKIRRRFNRETGTTNDEAELLNSVMASLSIGETAVGEAGEIADEESEDEEEGMYSDEEEAEHDGQSIRSRDDTTSVASQEKRPSAAPLATPDHLDNDLPPLLAPDGQVGKKKKGHERTGSSSRSSFDKPRSSMDKIRSSLHRKSSPDLENAEREGTGRERKDRPPPIQVPRSSPRPEGSGGKKSAARRAKERAAAARGNLQAPDTPAIDELRPLFMESVSCEVARLKRGRKLIAVAAVACGQAVEDATADAGRREAMRRRKGGRRMIKWV